MRKLYFLLLTVVLASSQLWAQPRTITGKVTNDAGNPVANATIQVKNSTVGTVTKENGTFSLSVPASARTLVISYVNMESQEVSIAGKSTFSVALKSSDKELQEAVVTGITRSRKSQFAGAANKIDAKEL